jgi:hypothetical protein
VRKAGGNTGTGLCQGQRLYTFKGGTAFLSR